VGGYAVVVAVQDAGRAKSRLGPDLDAGIRRTLVISMLDDLLTAIREVWDGDVVVVSADAVYDAVAREHRARVVRDEGIGYNEAVTLAVRHLGEADAVLILPGDLPHAAPAEIATLLNALDVPGVTLVPSDDGGTLALGLRPPNVMAPLFGPDSAARHREAAHAAGVPLRDMQPGGLRADVDTLEDLAAVWDSVGEATAALLEHLPITVPPRPAGEADD
jgi:2-phospho-L-lactate/phosphoenolpyruvate guanylyltransferase